MTLHIYRCENPRRTRQLCPYHKKMEYGELQEFYDTRRIFFDCGTFVDYGYGYYEPPKRYKRLQVYWDGELEKYILVATQSWEHLFESPNYKKVIKIAEGRLKIGGRLKLPFNPYVSTAGEGIK